MATYSGYVTIRTMKLIFSAALNFPCSGNLILGFTAASPIRASHLKSSNIHVHAYLML